ncbi:hypothetical protein Tco_0001437 [Tanacetum coccineum]
MIPSILPLFTLLFLFTATFTFRQLFTGAGGDLGNTHMLNDGDGVTHLTARSLISNAAQHDASRTNKAPSKHPLIGSRDHAPLQPTRINTWQDLDPLQRREVQTVDEAFVMANYSRLDPLMRRRMRELRLQGVATRLNYSSEDVDEEREMKALPGL